METSDLSKEFDILYNNITSNQAPGLSEYEKSVFLTQAQEAIISELYNGNLKDSFESSEAYTRYLNSIVEHEEVISNDLSLGQTLEFPNIESKFYKLNENVLFIIYEQVIVDGRTAIVIPTTHNELFNKINNPFKGPNNRRVLRASCNGTIELYYNDNNNIDKYTFRYIKKPKEVNLDTSDGLETPDVLHRTILLRAVQLAKAVWQS